MNDNNDNIEYISLSNTSIQQDTIETSSLTPVQPQQQLNNNNDEEELRLTMELHLIQKMKQAFLSSLQMLEAAKHDLIQMGLRMERLQETSRKCRTALQQQQQNQQQRITNTSTTTSQRNQEFIGQDPLI